MPPQYHSLYWPSQPSALRQLSQTTQQFMIQVGRSLLTLLVGSQTPRIRVYQDFDREIRFQLYDPASNQHYSFRSEQDIRAWLDQRYYL
ncbi:MAG: hypothetical protein F6K42_07525 [Leptolyngbya sp. SIO1D8]|nr:hypothetical protein [Leptolyngbya sp. SIO1D8]